MKERMSTQKVYLRPRWGAAFVKKYARAARLFFGICLVPGQWSVLLSNFFRGLAGLLYITPNERVTALLEIFPSALGRPNPKVPASPHPKKENASYPLSIQSDSSLSKFGTPSCIEVFQRNTIKVHKYFFNSFRLKPILLSLAMAIRAGILYITINLFSQNLYILRHLSFYLITVLILN